MGFTNFLRDLGSFAAPAAASAGLTVLSGGTLNPGTQAGLLSLLGAAGAGAGGFARNEQEERLRKAQKQQGKNQSMANLINTLNPRANYQARQAALPSPGTLETLASGTQQGIQAFRMAQQAQQALEDRAAARKSQDLNDALKKQQIGMNAGVLQGQLGAAAANSGGQVPVTIDSYSSRTPRRNVSMDIRDTGAPDAVMAGFDRQNAANAAALTKARQDAEKALLDKMNTLSLIESRESSASIAAEQLRVAQERLGLEQGRFEMEEQKIARDIERLRQESLAAMQETEMAIADRIVDVQPSIKTSDRVATNYLKVKSLVKDLLSGDAQTRGAGQITLVNVFNRGFVDEGVAVRKEDIDNLRAAQDAYSTLMARVQQFETGEALGQELVANIDATTERLYDAYIQALQGSVEARLRSSPGVTVESAERIQNFLLAPLYEVPSLSMIEAERKRRGA